MPGSMRGAQQHALLGSVVLLLALGTAASDPAELRLADCVFRAEAGAAIISTTCSFDQVAMIGQRLDSLEAQVALIMKSVQLPPSTPPPTAPSPAPTPPPTPPPPSPSPQVPPPPPPPAAPQPQPTSGVLQQATLCTSVQACSNLLSAGWSVMSDFGNMSPSRFGVTPLASTDAMAAVGWSFPLGTPDVVQPTDLGLSMWINGGASSQIRHIIPSSTKQLLVAFNAYHRANSYMCTATIKRADGHTLQSLQATDATDEVYILTYNFAAGDGTITFTESGSNICTLKYLLRQY